MKVKGRVQAIRSIRQQFSDVADPHKREKLINAAMKKGKIKLSALGEIFEFGRKQEIEWAREMANDRADHAAWMRENNSKGYGTDRKKTNKFKEMRRNAAKGKVKLSKAALQKRLRYGAYGAAAGVGLGAGSLLGNAINRRRKRKNNA